MKSNKAVMSASFIVGIIITLAAFMIIGGTVMRFVGEAEPKEAERLCHDSITWRAATTLQVEGTDIQLSPILCKTLDFKIEGEKERVMEQLAQKLARCWWMFGEGRYEQILDKEQLGKIFGLAKTKNDCFLCYTIMIEDKAFKGKITSQELLDYMRTHDYSSYNMSYLDYVQGFGGPGGLGLIAQEIEPGKAYGISFLAKNTEEKSWFGEIVGGTAVVAGLVSGYFLCGATVGLGCVIATGIAVAGGEVLGSAVGSKIDNLYTERDISLVYLSELKSAQEACFHGDLGGE